jgi:hypothetical protein
MSSYITPDVEKNLVASDDAIFAGKESPDVTIMERTLLILGAVFNRNQKQEKHPSQNSLLKTQKISCQRSKSEFFILIGLMFLVKNVCNTARIPSHTQERTDEVV